MLKVTIIHQIEHSLVLAMDNKSEVMSQDDRWIFSQSLSMAAVLMQNQIFAKWVRKVDIVSEESISVVAFPKGRKLE